MSRRTGRALGIVLFGALVAVAAAVCIRLGVWQLDRLAQRRAYNASVSARFEAGAEPLADALARDTAEARWRRVSARLVPDYTRERVLASRSRNGSPGVWVVTPARRPGSDTLVALLRGWVYSANGRTVDLAAWREADTLDVDGLLDAFHRPARGAVRLPSDARALRWLERDTLAAEWQAPVAAMLVYQLGDTMGGHASTGGTVPARFPVPAMDEGPHRSYAIQWFSFATVFVVGYAAVVVTGRRRARGARA